MEYADLPIEPITQNQITQIALWRDSQKSPVIDFFIGCLNKFAVDQLSVKFYSVGKFFQKQ